MLLYETLQFSCEKALFSDFDTVQTLSKSVNNCQSYWQKFRGTFLWPTVYNAPESTSGKHCCLFVCLFN